MGRSRVVRIGNAGLRCWKMNRTLSLRWRLAFFVSTLAQCGAPLHLYPDPPIRA